MLCEPHFVFVRGVSYTLTLRYTQALITTLPKPWFATCHRHHSITQQLCSWILFSPNQAQGDSLTLTQEFFSHMMGVRREGITAAALNLQQLGAITYSRGKIRVIDRSNIEAGLRVLPLRQI